MADQQLQEPTQVAEQVQRVAIQVALPDILRTVNILAMQQGEAAAQAAQVLPLPHQTLIALLAVMAVGVVRLSVMV